MDALAPLVLEGLVTTNVPPREYSLPYYRFLSAMMPHGQCHCCNHCWELRIYVCPLQRP